MPASFVSRNPTGILEGFDFLNKFQSKKLNHGLRTPNGTIWQTKYALAVPKYLEFNFQPCSEGYFISGRP